MEKHFVLTWVVAFFCLLAPGKAQTASPSTAGTRFDGIRSRLCDEGE